MKRENLSFKNIYTLNVNRKQYYKMYGFIPRTVYIGQFKKFKKQWITQRREERKGLIIKEYFFANFARLNWRVK